MKRTALFLLTIIAAVALPSCRRDPVKMVKGNPAAAITTASQARTLNTLKNEKDGLFYYMDYKADYLLDDILEAGCNSQKAVLGFMADRMLKTVPLQDQPEVACSAFTARTPEGDVIYGRNLDFRFTYTLAMMLRTAAKGSCKTLGIAALQFIKMPPASLDDGQTDISPLITAPYVTMDGVNEKGLAFSVLALSKGFSPMQFDPGKKDIFTTTLIRMVLDRAGTVEEAIELIKGKNYFAKGPDSEKGSYHYLLADATGKSVVLEYILPEGETSAVLNVVDANCVTNGYLSEGWDEVCNGGIDRMQVLRDALDANGGVMTEEEAMQLLASVSRGLNPEVLTSNTHWSVVYNLTKRTATVCVARDFDNPLKYTL